MKYLVNCSLFKGLQPEDITILMEKYGCEKELYPKKEIIALQGSGYNNLLIVADGTVTAETVDRQHNVIKVDRITAPSLIAPALLFAENNKLPVNLTARTLTTVIKISPESLLAMMRDSEQVMRNFLEIVSSSNRFVSENVVYLTYKTIKGKFANYLLELMEQTGGSSFRNPLTQQQMADKFGVTRPALARAIGEMANEETIYVKGKDVKILFKEKLLQYAKY